MVFCVLFILGNRYFSENEWETEIIYLSYMSIVIIVCVRSITMSCLHGNRFTGKHRRINFYSQNTISLLLGGFFGYWGVTLALDALNNRTVEQTVSVAYNRTSLFGPWLYQEIVFHTNDKGDVSLFFPLHSKYLKVGREYQIKYAQESGLVLTATEIQ